MSSERAHLRTILERASFGLGKIDHYGDRGLTMLSTQEIEALALLAATAGLVPTLPGADPADCLFLPDEVAQVLLFAASREGSTCA